MTLTYVPGSSMALACLSAAVASVPGWSGLGHWVWARKHRMPWCYAGQCLAIVMLVALWHPFMVWPQEPKPFGQLTDWLRVTGEMRGRIEYNNFFQPDPATNNNNEYTFGELRARFGLSATTKLVDVMVQAEYSGLYGLPDDAVASPGGALGTGALYFNEHPDTTQNDVHLHRLFLTLKSELLRVPGLSFTLGRFEILDGLEYRTGDPHFDYLKTTRISQRLIGTSDFTDATRAFDGVRGMYDTKVMNVVVNGVHPTQGGFNIRAGNTLTDVDVVYVALTAKRGSVLPGTEARLFYVFYHDDRPVQVVDNRPAALRPLLSADSLAIHSLGAHVLTVLPLGPGQVDGLVWGVYQFGQWTNLDQRAGALAVEVGYQLVGIPLAPWLRLGYFRGSGDSNPADGTHGTFFNVLPTGRLYANFPFYNLMNIENGFVQLILTPATSTRFVVAAHTLKLSEQNDLFYSGGGAQNRRVSFGYVGRASNGAQSLANVVETSLSHTFSKYFSGNVYYGHAFGSSVIERLFMGQSDADYFFAELTARF